MCCRQCFDCACSSDDPADLCRSGVLRYDSSHRSGFLPPPARTYFDRRFYGFGCNTLYFLLDILFPHMDIAIAIRMKQLPGKVGMFDGFSAAPVKMTDATAFSRGVAHVFSNLYQIHPGVGHPHPCRGFFIGPGSVMTHQAIDVAHIRKIKTVVFPAIACVTRCATSLVAYGANSEIVEGCCGFPVPDLLSVIHSIERWTPPKPVSCCQHILGNHF